LLYNDYLAQKKRYFVDFFKINAFYTDIGIFRLNNIQIMLRIA
jgi:hypothetical protein